MKRALVATVLLLAGCVQPAQPQPDRDAMVGHDDRPPACITAALEARYEACPTRGNGAPALICTPQGPAAEPVPPRRELVFDPSLRPAEPRLDAAHALADEAQQSGEEGALRRAEARLRSVVASLRHKPAFGYASYRFAHLLHARGEDERALKHLADAIRFGMDRSAVDRERALAERARADYVRLYARRGAIADADRAFAPLSPFEKTAPMLAELAAQLAATSRTRDLEVVMRQLALRDPDRRCSHQARVLDLARARGERRVVVHALNELLGAYDELELHEEDKNRCGPATAAHLLELADEWRTEGMGSGEAETLDLAEQLYRRVLATFSREQLARWGLCLDMAEMARRRGELLFLQQRWRECGQSYDDALGLAPRAPWAAQASYAAVVCRQNAWSETNEGRSGLSDEERIAGALQHTEDWRRMLGSFHRFLCLGGETLPEHAETALGRAEGFFEGGALWEAAVGFRIVAFSEGPPRDRAMRRYAEVAAPLAADDTCRLELRADLDRLLEARCAPQTPAARSEDCRVTHEVWETLQPEQL